MNELTYLFILYEYVYYFVIKKLCAAPAAIFKLSTLPIFTFLGSLTFSVDPVPVLPCSFQPQAHTE